MLLSAALAASLTLLLLLRYNMDKEKALAIVLLADDIDPSANVINHLEEFKVKVYKGDIAQLLHSNVSKVLFKQNVAPLPLVILVKGEKLLAVIAGLPSEQLWNKIVLYLSLNNTPFLAFSGPSQLLSKRLCSLCFPYGNLEEIFSISDNEAKEIQRLLKEAQLQYRALPDYPDDPSCRKDGREKLREFSARSVACCGTRCSPPPASRRKRGRAPPPLSRYPSS